MFGVSCGELPTRRALFTVRAAYTVNGMSKEGQFLKVRLKQITFQFLNSILYGTMAAL